MKRFLIINFETDSINPNTCKILEFGYLQSTYDKKIVNCGSFLFKQEKIISDFPDCNDIDNELLKYGYEEDRCTQKIQKLISESHYIVARNGHNFDFILLKRLCDINGKILIDTMIDLPLEKRMHSMKLSYLAFEHDVIMQSVHRAISDVIGLFQLICKFNFDKIIENATSEKVLLVLKNTPFNPNEIERNIEQNHKKELGFRWNRDNRRWELIARKNDIENTEKKCKLAGFELI